MSISKRFLWVIACTIATHALGQVAHSPFTKFGIGETYSSALINTQGMAGVGVSQPQTWFVNNQNPALLIYNRLATFQVGVLGESRKIKNDLTTEKNIGGNLNYLVIALPIKPEKWGSSLGLMPYSSVNFKYQQTGIVDGNFSKYQETTEGTGGITQLYWSNGVRINKQFAIGAKISYLFGAIDVINKIQQNNIVSSQEDKTVVKDFTFNLGASYSKDSLWGKDYRLSIGAVYNLGANVNSTFISKTSTLTAGSDTLASVTNPKVYNPIYIPPSFTGGISFSKNSQWVLGTEFSYQDWSTFNDPGKSKENLKQSWKAGFGGEFTPDPTAMEGFLKRTSYRIGFSTEQCPYLINNKPVKDSGISFGFSFPAGRSSLDLAFKFGKRGNTSQSVLEENYFKIFFGLTFNDQWFIRRRFD